MYCPKCLSDNLFLASRGVADLIINGKHMDAGKFIFNTEAARQKNIASEFEKKVEEFFKWYSGFNNIEPITQIQLISADVKCESCGFIPTTSGKVSVVDTLIPAMEMKKILFKIAEKYGLKIKLS